MRERRKAFGPKTVQRPSARQKTIDMAPAWTAYQCKRPPRDPQSAQDASSNQSVPGRDAHEDPSVQGIHPAPDLAHEVH